MLQECPLCGLCGPSYCNWSLNWLVCVINPQTGWLWGSTPTVIFDLLCRCWPQGAKFTSAVFCACWDLPLYMLLLKLIGSCCDAVWSWPFSVLVLGLFGGTVVQANIRHSLWLALGYLFVPTSDPQFVAASAVIRCVHEGRSCTQSQLLLALGLGAGQ